MRALPEMVRDSVDRSGFASSPDTCITLQTDLA